jgi:hypothetical protein
MTDQPDSLPIGASARLCSLRAFSRELRLPEVEARNLLASMHVPLIHLGGRTEYFNVWALEQIIFALTEIGSGGWDGSGPILASTIRRTQDSDFQERLRDVGRLYAQGQYATISAAVRRMAEALRKEAKPRIGKRGPHQPRLDK